MRWFDRPVGRKKGPALHFDIVQRETYQCHADIPACGGVSGRKTTEHETIKSSTLTNSSEPARVQSGKSIQAFGSDCVQGTQKALHVRRCLARLRAGRSLALSGSNQAR